MLISAYLVDLFGMERKENKDEITDLATKQTTNVTCYICFVLLIRYGIGWVLPWSPA